MRSLLLIVGFICCLVGGQFLIVDKVVLHAPRARSSRKSEEVTGPREPTVIDLPDSGGYVMVACGIACLMYYSALRTRKPS